MSTKSTMSIKSTGVSRWPDLAAGIVGRAAAPCLYGDRYTEGCCHRWRVRCHHPDVGGHHDPAYCADCPHRMPPTGLHIAAVITAWNEGDEVQATVRSLRESMREARLTVIVVDDGSTDGSCEALEGVQRIRHDTPQGVGRSRNAGWRRAVEMGADVVTFDDAHMRFEPGHLERLAVKALRSSALTTAASHDIPSRGRQRGCWLHYDPRYGLQPKWSTDSQVRKALGVGRLPEWWRTPCMMGACYVVPRDVGERLEAPTGQLWEDTAGRWGFSEQALAIKAFLLDVPVLQSRDLCAGHRYRSTNPVPDAAREVWRNVCRCTALLFGREAFDRRFRPWCDSHLDRREVERIASEALQDRPQAFEARCRQVFTHLLGIGAPVTEPHPEHAWLDDLREACRSLTGNPRVLQWRPGESTMALLEELPSGAKVTCIEYPGRRAGVWRSACAAAGVRLLERKLNGDYAEGPLSLAREEGEFDLVLVGGEVQERCMSVATQVVKPGGRIVRNPAADRLQIEHECLKEEEKRLKERARPPRKNEPLVTVCLLNWARLENVGRVLESIATQTLPVRVFLWNNGEPRVWDAGDEITWTVRSSRNAGCFPRWLMASLAETEFVCSMDDDLVFSDERVLEDAVAACREECPDGIVGFFGWSEVEGQDYRGGVHHNGTTAGTRCDVIKGRFMFFRRRLLERVPLGWPVEANPHADDIYLSLCISGGRPGHHLIPARLCHRWEELPGRGAGVSSRPGHYERRWRVVRAMKEWLADRQHKELVEV